MRHRRGTPGLTPYRLRTIEAGYPRRRRPARHLRGGKAPAPQPGVLSPQPSAPVDLATPLEPAIHLDLPAHVELTPRPATPSKPSMTSKPTSNRCRLARRGAAVRQRGAAVRKRGTAVRQRGAAVRRRVAGSQVAMGFAGLIALAMLIVGGYQAATGAAVVLGMF